MTKTNHLGSLAATVGMLAAVGLLVLMLVLIEARPAEATSLGEPGKIAYSSFDGNDYDIYTIDSTPPPAGVRPFQVTDNTTNDFTPDYSPKTEKIAYWGYDGFDGEIYTIGATGGTPFQLTDNTTRDREPSYSPDATNIAYTGYDGNDYEIYRIDALGATGKQGLVRGQELSCGVRTAPYDCTFSVRRQGGCARRIVQVSDRTNPSWKPPFGR